MTKNVFLVSAKNMGLCLFLLVHQKSFLHSYVLIVIVKLNMKVYYFCKKQIMIMYRQSPVKSPDIKTA